MTMTLAPDLSNLPAPLRALAERHERERRATVEQEAEAARAALATLDDSAVRRLLADAAKKRGAVEVLRQKLTAAEQDATEAHRAYSEAALTLDTERARLRRLAVPAEDLAAGLRQLEDAMGDVAKPFTGRPLAGAAARAGRAVLLEARRVLTAARDGVGELPTEDVATIVARAITEASEAARVEYREAEARDARHREEMRLRAAYHGP
jgi:hypothetical protein